MEDRYIRKLPVGKDVVAGVMLTNVARTRTHLRTWRRHELPDRINHLRLARRSGR